MLKELQILCWRLLLEEPSNYQGLAPSDEDYVLRKAVDFIGRGHESSKQRRFDAKLFLAAHLSPREALSYDQTNPTPRHELIKSYLTENFGFEKERVDQLSRSIHKLLDAWESERTGVTYYRDRLLESQDNTCASCRIEFGATPKTASNQDPYKPYKDRLEELTSPEVDHVDSVSTFGTNNYENLQVLCRFCNFGKGDGLGVDSSKEIQYAGKQIKEIPWSHKSHIFYYVLERDGFRCAECSAVDTELTIRPIRNDGGYLRSNLATLCANCAFESDSVPD